MKKSQRIIIAALLLSLGISTETEAADNQEIIAHRGASAYAPEHTISSYDLSYFTMNSDYIELDLQMTKDKQLVAMHDETVDRTTNGTGFVKDYTVKKLKRLDAGSWFNEKYPSLSNPAYINLKVPTLKEILKRYGKDARYYIETKSPEDYPGMEEALIKVLNDYGLTTKKSLRDGHLIIQSFSENSLKDIKKINSSVPRIQLIEKGTLASVDNNQLQAIKKYAMGIGPNYNDLSVYEVNRLHNNGLLVHTYTVNKKSAMRKMNQYGVDGIFTNYPDVYQSILSSE